MSRLKAIFSLLKETLDEWNKDRAPRLAAALAYFTTFSIAPFLVVVIAVAGLVVGREALMGHLDEQIQGLVGRDGADFIQELIKNVRRPTESIVASAIGIATLLLGAGAVFGQLQDALNTVWGVEPKPQGILGTIKDRFISFTMVLGVGFMLLVSLVISAILGAANNYFLGILPQAEAVLRIVNIVISLGVTTLLFAMMYKIVPDVEIRWRDVWIGAAFTAVLFTIGKELLGLYLGNSGVTSTYGAAGALVILLLWIFYSAQILLFGAEFTQVYAQRYGSRILPKENARPIGTAERVEQGMSPKQTAVQGTGVAVMDKAAAPPALMFTAPVEEPPQPTKLKRVATLFMIASSFLSFLFGLALGRERDEEERRFSWQDIKRLFS